jgi:hypothetical protein
MQTLLCRAPPLVRKTRAQLKQEADAEAAATQRQGSRPTKQEQRQAANGELPKQEEEEEEMEEDVNIMDALDAFSALAGPRNLPTQPAQISPLTLWLAGQQLATQ